MSKQEELFDTGYIMETPEGVDLHVDIAGPVVRTLAFLIDLAIRSAFLLVLGIVLAFMGSKVGAAVFLIALFLTEWFYPVLFEVFRGGQTPGKKSMGIMVINDDLTPVTLGPSMIRNLLRNADILPMFYVLGYFSIAMHPHFKRLGDISAGTLVVYKAEESEQHAPAEFKPEASPLPLTLDEQTAVVDFTLRHEQLSESRQQELAEILCGTMNKPKSAIVGALRSMGAWFLGAR